MLTFAITTLVAAFTGLMVRRHWWLTRVRSWSMYPTLRPGDHLWTRRLPRTADISRGDIVVIDSTELGHRIVKRVIGLPGETVQVSHTGVTIDDQPLHEPYVRVHGGATGSYHVPPESFLVLGDNRPHSSDSRIWTTPYPERSTVRGATRRE